MDANVSMLHGKTIKKAYYSKISDEFDDIPYLDLEMEDGTKFRITSYYGGYSGNSEDEYPAFISVKQNG